MLWHYLIDKIIGSLNVPLFNYLYDKATINKYGAYIMHAASCNMVFFDIIATDSRSNITPI